MRKTGDDRQRRAGGRSKSAGRKRWLLYLLLLLLALAAWQVLRRVYQDRERQARMSLRESIEKRFPEATARLKAAYGLRRYPDDSAVPASGGDRKPHVVLIHGLDDPGKVWTNLAPRLIQAGFQVWILNYPNDQPIIESARLLLLELEAMKKQGIDSIDIVAHSMGGLVTREALTNPDWQFTVRSHNGLVPKLKRFIMVGTPNHGSELARFRILAEFRDQLAGLAGNTYHWLQPVVDGAGEAGIDLLPGSRFLKSLNSRPHPPDVKMLVIAGTMSPWQAEEIHRFIGAAKKNLPESAGGRLDQLERWLNKMSLGLGDGLVTVTSARLEGVPQRIVRGNHLTIIRNLRPESRHVPPAIPIIINELSRGTGIAP